MLVTSMEGRVLTELKATEGSGEAGKTVEWVAGCVSAGGLWAYGLSVSGWLFVFDVKEGTVAHSMRLHKADGVALAAHPHLNVLASSAQDSTVRLWR